MKNRSFLQHISLLLLLVILITNIKGVVSLAAGQAVVPSGMSVSDLTTEIEAYIQEHQDTTAAVSVAVFHNDETLHQGYYGYMNLETGLENTEETVMEWGSVTKLLVWVSVMQLVEADKLDLTEDIGTYLPEGFLSKLKFKQAITMENLMHHNAGWQDQLLDLFLPLSEEIAALGSVLKNTRPEQVYEPGTVVAYSNWGVSLAGHIVENISGLSFSEYVHQNIFEPLGMIHTALLPTLEDNTWVSDQRDLLNCYTTNLQNLGTSRYQIALYPAGMATGTAGDFLLFGKALVPKKEDASKLFKKRETLQQFLEPSLFYQDENKTPRNAHGLWIDKTDGLALGHGGNTVGASANLQFDPVSGAGLLVMTNQGGESTYNVGFQEMIFGTYPRPSEDVESADISGVYTQARTIKSGGLRFLSFLQTMPVMSRNEHLFHVPISGMQFVSAGPERILVDYGFSEGTGYFIRNEDGSVKLEIGVQDFLSKNPLIYAFEIGLILFLGLALLYSLFTLFSFLLRKVRHKPVTAMDRNRVWAGIGILGLFASFAYSASMVITYQAGRYVNFGFFLCAIFTVWIVAVLIYTIMSIKWKSMVVSRVKYAFLIIACTAMLANSIYWQWFKFW